MIGIIKTHIAFCDYCDIIDTYTDEEKIYLSRAQSIGGSWICDICYYFLICSNSKNDPNLLGPCRDKCNHRPQLISKWEKFKNETQVEKIIKEVISENNQSFSLENNEK